jgi:hypothetical protein
VRTEPKPPWVLHPGNDPTWAGWRQGVTEAGLRDLWLRFWHALRSDNRARYLERWPPPTQLWHIYVTVHWLVGTGDR